MRYNISYEKDNVYQTCLIVTDRPKSEIKALYAKHRGIREDQIFGVREATADDDRPGKPKIRL